MITDLNCAVYEMKRNGYPLIEIASALNLSDEDVEKIDSINQNFHSMLEEIRLGNLKYSDLN